MTDFQFRFWTYLITYVDDFGRGSADPEILKGFVFPRRKGVTEGTIQKTLAELATIGSVTLYEVDGEPYLCFPNWGDHQQIRTKVSKFPAPEDGKVTETGTCNQLISDDINCNHLISDAPRIQSNTIRIQNPNPESEYESENTPHTPQGGRFAEFWAQYPKKVGKGAAEKAFDRIKPDKQTFDRMMSAISAQKQSRQWTENNGQYIPNPATWLNQRRWEDELPQGETDNVFLQMLQEEGQHEPY
jgi:hypothetical protein